MENIFCSIIFSCNSDIFRVIRINVKFQVTCQSKRPPFCIFSQLWFRVTWLKMLSRVVSSGNNMFRRVGGGGVHSYPRHMRGLYSSFSKLMLKCLNLKYFINNLMKHDHEWFLEFAQKCWHGYINDEEEGERILVRQV